ncbi:MAG: cryptochrome/photolyase family protein [Bacteroidota bacterium]
MKRPEDIAVFWFRRDLRLHDNRALTLALQSGLPVLGLFVLDRNILDRLEDRDDARVTFLLRTLGELRQALQALNSDLLVLHSTPDAAWDRVTQKHQVALAFWNRDYEPYAVQRDRGIVTRLQSQGIQVQTAADHTLMEPGTVLKPDGNPYTVFTPYAKMWRQKIREEDWKPLSSRPSPPGRWLAWSSESMPTLEDIGFVPTRLTLPESRIHRDILVHYADQRDLPAVQGTSRLGLHLRFGTLSIRALAQAAMGVSDTFVNELIWRDFYQSILWYFPRTTESAFKPAYDRIVWRNNPEEFERWCQGQTGYPLVDAGMRELLSTGWMHNRVRMVVASFLTKHLLIDWRWGEAWFARHLLDFEQASNVGGWQWAAGCGNDAAPYFRVFNPYEQARKFDPQGVYIRRWIPEIDTLTYPQPIVDHPTARNLALETYKKALSGEL